MQAYVWLQTGTTVCHELVTTCRRGADVHRLLAKPGTVLHELARNVTVIEDPVPSDISATRVREQLAAGRSVRYLTPDCVIDYVHACHVYPCGEPK